MAQGLLPALGMRVGSLFSGIGGIDLGLERAGMKVVWQVEREPFCQRVLRKHWPHVALYEDVRDVGAHNLEPVDIIAGGFPCQDISVAGKGAGIEGERSGLWREFARIIGELRPLYALIENVPALRSRGLARVLQDLDALGYDAEWHCVPAACVGAPHSRDRIWIIAYAECPRGARLVESTHPGTPGPWRFRDKEDLLALAAAPFERGDRWPQPLLRRMDDGLSCRMDRLRAVGNAVVPQVVELLGASILEHWRESR